MRRMLTRIPFPGGSGLVPTGPMQFRDDWPGLFIRGDDAASLASELEELFASVGKMEGAKRRFYRTNELIEIIRRDVIVRSDPD